MYVTAVMYQRLTLCLPSFDGEGQQTYDGKKEQVWANAHHEGLLHIYTVWNLIYYSYEIYIAAYGPTSLHDHISYTFPTHSMSAWLKARHIDMCITVITETNRAHVH